MNDSDKQAILELRARAMELIFREQWDDSEFSWQRAYVCALFAHFAYAQIPPYELKNHRRIKVVPSGMYQRLARTETAFDLAEFIRDEFLQTTVIVRRYVVLLVVCTPSVIFVAVRGTKALYDWSINLNVRRRRVRRSPSDLYFHRGFYDEAVACIPALRDKLSDVIHRQKPVIPVYFTGHSLGGAIAAILYAIWPRRLPMAPDLGTKPEWPKLDFPPESWREVSTTNAYTFGMPCFGNLAAVSWRSPHHVFNDEDIVPAVPPSWLGFSRAPHERMVGGNWRTPGSKNETFAFNAWISNLAIGRKIREHSMELYVELVDTIRKRPGVVLTISPSPKGQRLSL